MSPISLDQLTLNIAALHAERRRLARQAMTPQAAMVFDLVPALLHCQDQALPGGEEAAPHGIRSVEDEPLRKRLATRLGVKADSPSDDSILAVYSMGSTGTLGQTRCSDLDIWVCHRSCLGAEERQALAAKCDRLTDWGKGQGMDLTFFLIDPEQFRQGNKQGMSGESCGSFQHWLLLDEFYRSAICLAGQLPIWLLVSPDDKTPYLQAKANLFAKGVDPHQWIDLGSPDPIPADEFLGSMLWLLYKGIENPYKALLKLTLMSAYARQYPAVRLLCNEFRRALHRGETEVMALDPYLLLEQYLRELDLGPVELDTARTCLYFKCGGDNLLELPANHAQALADLAQSWGWDQAKREQLQDHRHWPLAELQEWHLRLREQMLAGLHEARELFRRTGTVSRLCPIELTVLSRKLDAAFAEKPNKLQQLCLPPRVEMGQPSLVIRKDGQWQLACPQSAKTLYQCQELPGLLAWCLLNGLISSHTELQLESDSLSLDSLDSLCRSMAWLGEKIDPAHQILAQPAQLERAQIIINLEQDATRDIKLKRGQVPNPLMFGEEKEVLVGELTLVVRNTWGECTVQTFRGNHALAELLLALLPLMPGDSLQAKRVHIHCFASQLGETIAHKVLDLIAAAQARLTQGPWTLCVGNGKWVFWYHAGELHWQEMTDPLAFYAALSAAKLEQHSHSKDPSVPAPVYAHALCGLVQFFFINREDGYSLYVSNEQNQISYYHYPAMDKANLVNLISRFYTQKESLCPSATFNLPQYYELVEKEGHWQMQPLTTSALSEP
ncbi:class I adenylate cyclase [Gallaecimonas kandeliae]|uniref:class I adenylate cyclase n=1 Tax=Gallaecimonas kandeliae TaxID=3029055 RepID=UPI0026492DF8|nr:class I adenylate cyclase [Gallaecimonas kandeliae]WKE65568.1 class I adenylate cyclase [Gallaecimonas kandeliae]